MSVPENHDILSLHSESVLDVVFDTLPSGLMLLTTTGEILRINRRSRLLLCVGEDEKLQTVHDFPDFLDPLKELLCYVNEDRHRSEVQLDLPSRQEPSTIGYNINLIAADKLSIRALAITAKHRLPESAERQGHIIAFTFADITQVLKDRQAVDKIRDELHQSKKLASIGTMISGVAHELNNPLTGISMSAGLGRMNLERLIAKLSAAAENSVERDLAEKLKLTLDEINKITRSCDKAAALVGDLLSYSKPTHLEMVPTDYVQLVQETVHTMRSHPACGVFAMTVRQPMNLEKPFIVACDRIKIEQVFYNLCKNACDAGEGKGKLEVWFTEGESPVGLPWVIAHVKDYGPGIDKTVLNRIFDPFFSTKGNKGVGLGLSISYRTLEQHDGMLSVESKPGEWTEFQVALPLYEEKTDDIVD